MLIDSSLTSLETLPSPHGLLPVRQAAEDAKQPITVKTQLCRMRLGSARSLGPSPPLLIALADLSTAASVLLHGTTLAAPWQGAV